VGNEKLGKLLFVPHQFRGFIAILLVTVIAADSEAAFQSRRRRVGIYLAKGNLMPIKQILPKMKPMVLAHHHPAITRIFPHAGLLWAITLTGWENQ
jgi:hypothetical protein